jgi:hypothetical protein
LVESTFRPPAPRVTRCALFAQIRVKTRSDSIDLKTVLERPSKMRSFVAVDSLPPRASIDVEDFQLEPF